MDTQTLITVEQLAAMPEDGIRRELVNGELRMMSPGGWRHGRIGGRLYRALANHVIAYNLGDVGTLDPGFILARNPDTVLAPDVAFISSSRLGQLGDDAGFLPLVPDLVAEVVSPSDTKAEVEAKTQAWLGAGVRLVLVVDPDSKTIRAARPQGHIEEFHTGQCIDCGDVVPGWTLDVDEVFARP